jgi:glycerophosphoryl diester phosphodiesterase
MPRKRAQPGGRRTSRGDVRAPRPIVIGHRGASGYVPEHTLPSYFIALQQGADYAEPDLVMTKDGVLVARHENEIGGTTDVAEHPEFARRRTTKVVDGVEMTGWFTEDFTLAELKTLRARERIPDIRPANTRFDRQFEIPTFDEILALIRYVNAERKRILSGSPLITSPLTRSTLSKANLQSRRRSTALRSPAAGVYPETKHPTYFDNLGLSMDRPLLQSLKRFGYTGPTAKVFIQSFETQNLKRMRRRTTLPMVQLIEASGAPYGESHTYAELISPAGLREIAKYANAIGPNKSLILPRDADQRLTAPTTLVRDAHAARLAVHPWTFRAEQNFLPADRDLASELRVFIDTGIDGFFTDHPDIGSRVVNR